MSALKETESRNKKVSGNGSFVFLLGPFLASLPIVGARGNAGVAYGSTAIGRGGLVVSAHHTLSNSRIDGTLSCCGSSDA